MVVRSVFCFSRSIGRSPRNLCIFIDPVHNMHRIKVSQKTFYSVLKTASVAVRHTLPSARLAPAWFVGGPETLLRKHRRRHHADERAESQHCQSELAMQPPRAERTPPRWHSAAHCVSTATSEYNSANTLVGHPRHYSFVLCTCFFYITIAST